jgi:2-methylcitrate dehydratase PrpD
VTAERVVGCRFHVPPLTARLIGRPVTERMTAGYARLCLQYVGAVCLHRGDVWLDDFSAAALADPAVLALARRLTVVEDGNPNPNALMPQRVEIDLAEGRTVACTMHSVLGSPEWPLSPEAARAKFDACWRTLPTLRAEQGEALWMMVGALESLDDARILGTMAAHNGGP